MKANLADICWSRTFEFYKVPDYVLCQSVLILVSMFPTNLPYFLYGRTTSCIHLQIKGVPWINTFITSVSEAGRFWWEVRQYVKVSKRRRENRSCRSVKTNPGISLNKKWDFVSHLRTRVRDEKQKAMEEERSRLSVRESLNIVKIGSITGAWKSSFYQRIPFEVIPKERYHSFDKRLQTWTN